MVSGADRSEPLLGFYFEGRHRAKGWDHVWERCLNTGRCCDVWAPQLLLLLAPFAAFMAILGHYKELKKKKKSSLQWVCHEWGRKRVMCHFWSWLGNVSYAALAARIEGNSVVPELGFFFSSMPSPAPLSPCNLFGLQISFPNSLRAVFLFFKQFAFAGVSWLGWGFTRSLCQAPHSCGSCLGRRRSGEGQRTRHWWCCVTLPVTLGTPLLCGDAQRHHWPCWGQTPVLAESVWVLLPPIK